MKKNITLESILFLITVPLAIVLIHEGCKYYNKHIDDAIFDIMSGIFLLIVWIKEVIEKIKQHIKNNH